MKDLSRHIEYLLCEHNSVAIPGIGLFITEEFPARYYMDEGIYLPPVRSVSLDITQTQDDGRLEDCLVQLHQVTRNVARKWISEYVNDINQSLLDMGCMDMGTIGRLVIVDDRIEFEACEAGVNTPELYGLDSFHMLKLPVHALDGRHAKDSTHFTIRLRKATVHRFMAAAAVIIIALLVVIPDYGTFEQGNLCSQIASADKLISFFNKHPHPTAQQQDKYNSVAVTDSKGSTQDDRDSLTSIATSHHSEPLDNNNENEVITKEVEVEITEESASVPNENSSATAESVTNSDVSGYCVVMASAITHKGAISLISKLASEGFHNAVEYNDKGMLRVLLTGYHNEEAARAELALVRATDKLYSGSWIKVF